MSEPIVLGEYRDWAGALAPEDAAFLARELGGRFSVQRQLQGDGYLVNPQQWVGVLTLPSGGRLESRPKVPIGNLFYMLAVARDLPFRDELTRVESVEQLLELVAAYFAGLVERRIALGLYREYVEREENLTVVRGRIAVAEDVRRNYVLRHRTYCRYAELTWDIPENGVIRQVVRLLSGWDFRPPVRLRLAHLDAALAEVAPAELPVSALDGFVYHRLNEAYRELHALCRLFLEGSSLHEEAGPHALPTFLLDMNALFEGFVTRLLSERAAPPVVVREQVDDHLDRGRAVVIRPDIVVYRGGGPILIADCKYKLPNPGRLVAADVYQMLAYCTAIAVPRGLLIYPRHMAPSAVEIAVRNTGTVVRGVSIDLGRPSSAFVRECEAFADAILASA